MVDYETGNPELDMNLQYNVNGPVCTTDGNQVVLFRTTDSNSDILFFDTGIFQLNKKRHTGF